MIYQPIPVLRCPKCRRYIPATLSNFTSAPKRKLGLYTYCRECDRAHHSQWEAQNRDKRLKQKGEAALRYRAKHPEKVKQINSKSGKTYFQGHKIEAYVRGARRRAKEKGLPSTLTNDDWNRALSYFGGFCAYCGRPAGFWHTLAQDHFVPVNKGGGYTPDNIVPACHGVDGCNNSKNNNDPADWLTRKFGKRKANAILKRIREYFEWIKTTHD
jgi:hypothetical protein